MAVTLSLALTACGTSANSATITNLGNQLDETANTVSNIQTVNPTDLNLTKNMLETMSNASNSKLYSNAYNTQQNLINEEYYKTDILKKTANIKNSISKDIKLSKAQITAVKDLTSSLAKYTNSIAYTQGEMTNAIKSISSMKKNIDKNSDKINAKLNRLACNSNSRSSYYENLLNTLEQLETCLDVEDDTTSQNIQTLDNKTDNSDNASDTTDNEQDDTNNNIDTYRPGNKKYKKRKYCPNCQPNYPSNFNENINNARNYNQLYNPNTVNNGTYNNPTVPYGNVYNRFNRFNPSRNTDTYGPTMKNIDTYGYNAANNGYGYGMNGLYRNGVYGYGNGMFGNRYNFGNGLGYGYRYGLAGYNGGLNGAYSNKIYNSNNFNRMTMPNNTTFVNSEQGPRLEDYEEVKEDNSVEKIENISNKLNETKRTITDSNRIIQEPKDKNITEADNNSNQNVEIKNVSVGENDLQKDSEKFEEMEDKTSDEIKENENLEPFKPQPHTESKNDGRLSKMPSKNSKIRIIDVSKTNDADDELNREIKAN